MRKAIWAICSIITYSLSGCGPLTLDSVHQATIDSFAKEGKPFIISGVEVHWIDSVGGVDIGIGSDNISNKTVKYVRYEVTPYNQVGDIQRSEIGGVSTTRIYSTGPYAPMTTIGEYWGDVWYNNNISCFVINRATVEYMDGSKSRYDGAGAVQNIMLPGMRNSCQASHQVLTSEYILSSTHQLTAH